MFYHSVPNLLLAALLNAAIKIVLFLLSWQIIALDFPYVVY